LSFLRRQESSDLSLSPERPSLRGRENTIIISLSKKALRSHKEGEIYRDFLNNQLFRYGKIVKKLSGER
jgi:hypothetical protein